MRKTLIPIPSSIVFLQTIKSLFYTQNNLGNEIPYACVEDYTIGKVLVKIWSANIPAEISLLKNLANRTQDPRPYLESFQYC